MVLLVAAMARETIPAHLQTSRGVRVEKLKKEEKGISMEEKKGILRDLVCGVWGEGGEVSEDEHLSGGQGWVIVVIVDVGLVGGA